MNNLPFSFVLVPLSLADRSVTALDIAFYCLGGDLPMSMPWSGRT